MKIVNPALRADAFTDEIEINATSEVMTVKGTILKTLVLFIILMGSSAWIWSQAIRSLGGYSAKEQLVINYVELFSWMVGGFCGQLILGFITIAHHRWAKYTAPIYAVCEGFFIGGISLLFEKSYPGIVLQSSLLTLGIFAILLFAYKINMITVTDNFRSRFLAATGGICFFYSLVFLLFFLGVNFNSIQGSGALSNVISPILVALATLNLVLDFEFIKNATEQGASKHMEWYAAFGLIVTLVWLYIEILNLFSKNKSPE